LSGSETSELIVLAGDMALRAGLAIGSTHRGYLASTVVDVHLKRRNRGLARAMKHMALRIRKFAAQSGVEQVDCVAYEEPTMHTRNANRLPQYATISALIWAGDDLGCRELLAGYWPSNVKKRATGDGRADKAAMLRAAQKWSLNSDITDHNEADAVMILKCSLDDLLGENS